MKDRGNRNIKEEDVSSYCMTLRKREDTGNQNRRHQMQCGELAVEKSMDLS